MIGLPVWREYTNSEYLTYESVEASYLTIQKKFKIFIAAMWIQKIISSNETFFCFHEYVERIKEQEGELVFLAMTVPDYEVMAMNMKELQRYITELKDVVVYYRKVTTTNVDQK